jgi:hypothetical protein
MCGRDFGPAFFMLALGEFRMDPRIGCALFFTTAAKASSTDVAVWLLFRCCSRAEGHRRRIKMALDRYLEPEDNSPLSTAGLVWAQYAASNHH